MSDLSPKIMVLSYNEGEKTFKDIDFKEVMEKIGMMERYYKNNPRVIVLCSQEAYSQDDSFGNILNDKLKNNYYCFDLDRSHLPVTSQIVKGIISHTLGIISKKLKYRDVRTKIFVSYNSPSFIRPTDVKYNFQIHFSMGKGSICSFLTLGTYNFIFVNSHYAFKGSGNTGLSKRKQQFIKTIMDFELYKYVKTHQIFFSGDLNFRLSKDFFEDHKKNLNEYEKKYIFNNKINHISPTMNLNNENIMNIKNLNSKENLKLNKIKINGKVFENIFNSKLNPVVNSNVNPVVNSNVNPEIFKKLHYYIDKLNENAISHNELYKFLKDDTILLGSFKKFIEEKEEISTQIKELLENFKKSIEDVGIYVTCRYSEGKEMTPINPMGNISPPTQKVIEVEYNNRGLAKLDRLIKKKTEEMNVVKEKIKICGDIVSCEKHGTPRIPSMCDKILYSFPDNINPSIKPEFFTFNIPYKSDHKMIGLFYSDNNEKLKKNNYKEQNYKSKERNYKSLFNRKSVNYSKN